MTAATIDNHKFDSEDTRSILKLKRASVPDEKHIHLIIKRDDISRLEKLKSVVYPHTQTEVFTNALQLFEAMLEEHNQGSVFYVERSGKEPEKFEVFD